MSTDAVHIGEAVLDSWAEPDDLCDQTCTVTVGGEVLTLHCEDNAGHEPPCSATIHWYPK